MLGGNFSIDSVIEEWIIFWRELRNAGFLTREGGGPRGGSWGTGHPRENGDGMKKKRHRTIDPAKAQEAATGGGYASIPADAIGWPFPASNETNLRVVKPHLIF
jgi:hypothetical protein